MKKFWSYFFLSVLILASGFMLTSLTMASVHKTSLVDEWKSWFPAVEESVETEDNNQSEDVEVDVEEETETLDMVA